MTRSVRRLALPAAVLVALVATACSGPGHRLERTPMSEVQFWHVIDAARGTTDATARAARPSALRTKLDRMSDAQIEAFDLRYGLELASVNSWSVWDAGYAAAGGMGDDDFDYFRSWLIGKGEATVQQVRTDPDGLVRYLSPVDATQDGFDDEELAYAADDVLTERIGSDRADAFDDDAMLPSEGDPAGTETPESSIDAWYPRLAAWEQEHPSN